MGPRYENSKRPAPPLEKAFIRATKKRFEFPENAHGESQLVCRRHSLSSRIALFNSNASCLKSALTNSIIKLGFFRFGFDFDF